MKKEKKQKKPKPQKNFMSAANFIDSQKGEFLDVNRDGVFEAKETRLGNENITVAKKRYSQFSVKNVTASNQRDGAASNTTNGIVGSTIDSWVPAWQGIWETNSYIGGSTTRLNTSGVINAEWIQFEFNGPVSIEHFTFFGRDNTEAKWLPSDFQILGSHDGSKFTVLNTWTGIEMSQCSHASSLDAYKTMIAPETTSVTQWRNDWNTGTGKNFFKKFDATNTIKKEFVYHRILITKVTGGKAISISEIEFKQRTGKFSLSTIKDIDSFKVPVVNVMPIAQKGAIVYNSNTNMFMGKTDLTWVNLTSMNIDKPGVTG